MFTEEKLISIIRQGQYDEAISALESLNFNEPIANSKTWLHIASESGNVLVTKYLINNGSQIDAVDNFGNTPLILASQNYNERILYELCIKHARVLTANHRGESSAKIIINRSHISEYILEMILEKIKLECRNDSKLTAKKLIEIGCPADRAKTLKDPIVNEYMANASFDVTMLQEAINCFDAEHLLAGRASNVNIVNGIVRRQYFESSPN